MDEERRKIILIDDNMSNLTMGRELLKEHYMVYPANSAPKLFEILEKIIPELILLDIEMPEMNGYETIKILKNDERYKDIPVIFLTAKGDEGSELKGFTLGAADYVSKPFSGPLLMKRIENQLLIVRQRKDLLASRAALRDYADTLEIKVKEKTAEVVNLQNAVLATVADLVEFRDKQTGGHISRTREYLKALVAQLAEEGLYKEEMRKWDMDFFLLSAQLHDVGKIAINDTILRKPGKLDEDEFKIMKEHVTVGVEAIGKIMDNAEEHAFLRHALNTAGAHHEKWDGSGYPLGLRGNDIPLEGRLMAIADVYDALVSARPYKAPMTHEQASEIIEAGAGTHFDPVLVEIYKKIKHKFADIVKGATQ